MTKEEAKITFLNTLQDDNFIENVNNIFDELFTPSSYRY